METNRTPSSEILASVRPAVLVTLGELRTAQEVAQDLERPPWEFALDISVLSAAGSTQNALRWLLGKGYVEQRLETTGRAEAARSFEAACPYSLPPRTCFLLTPSGCQFAETILGPTQSGTVTGSSEQPRWDATRGELWVGDLLVKRFRQRATNQALILQAFQESGWPLHLDDPLLTVKRVNRRKRLADAIRGLNLAQERHLLRFHSRGSGTAIGWKLLSAPHEIPKIWAVK